MSPRRPPRVARAVATLAAALLLPFAATPVVLSQEMAPVLPGALEGRPPAAETSPLQARIDAAVAGSTVEVEPGEYAGDLVVDKPLRLVGRGRPRLLGSGKGSVVRVRADDVTVEGCAIDGRRGGDLSRDSAGVHSAALSDGTDILFFSEDIGRHNAVDKLIGKAFLKGVPIENKILFTSGRVTSEIVTKAGRNRFPILISRAAASCMAISYAEDMGITLVGFARGDRMNIYTWPNRIRM